MNTLKGLRVKSIMTNDVCYTEVPGHRLDALNVMKQKDISGLPVVEKGTKKFIGMISRHDIYDKPDKEQIAMLYKEDGVHVTPNTNGETLVKRFLDSGEYWMPVLDRGQLVGIVTPADLLRQIEIHGKGRSVKEFMGRHSCIPIYHKSPISVALHFLRITRIPALPVINSKARLIGIISDMDVFRILISEEKTGRGIRLDVEDDDWTWEGIRNFKQIYAMPDVKVPDLSVENVMVKNVKFLYPHSDVAGAAKTMRVNSIGQLPICDSDDVLVGMIYNYDLLPVLLP